MKHVNRGWRLIATGLSFALFGLGGLVVGILIAPALWIVVRDAQRRERHARTIIGYGCKAFAETMRRLGVLRYEIRGREHEQVDGGCLIVANHPSLIDVIFLLSAFPDADCVIKASMWKNVFMMAAVRAANYIPNNNPVAILETCVERLEDGRKLILFPEGTRTAPDQRPSFNRGAASIAMRAEVPCLPVLIRCTPTTLTKSDHWYDIPERQVFFQMTMLAPLLTRSYLANGDSERRASRRLNDDLLRILSGSAAPADTM